MTPKERNRIKTQRRRCAQDIGLQATPRNMWYDPAKHGETIKRIQQETEAMIAKEHQRRFGGEK